MLNDLDPEVCQRLSFICTLPYPCYD
jgi:hypothetical protein